jgi:hypothetical protein
MAASRFTVASIATLPNVLYFTKEPKRSVVDRNNYKYKKSLREDKTKVAADITMFFVLIDKCNVNIASHYFKDSLVSSEMLIVAKLYDRDDPDAHDSVLGFVLGKIINGQQLYVDIICAVDGMGRTLLQKVEEIAFELGLNSVTLNALPEVLPFYEKIGYSHRSSCAADAIAYRNYSPAKTNCKNLNTSALCGKTERSQNCSYKQCVDPDAADCDLEEHTDKILNEEYLEYMLELNERKLVAGNSPACAAENIAKLSSKKKMYRDFVNNNCLDNGLVMTKCALTPPQSQQNQKDTRKTSNAAVKPAVKPRTPRKKSDAAVKPKTAARKKSDAAVEAAVRALGLLPASLSPSIPSALQFSPTDLPSPKYHPDDSPSELTDLPSPKYSRKGWDRP